MERLLFVGFAMVLGVGVCVWLGRRLSEVLQQRDSLQMQLGNALLDLRTDTMLEFVVDQEPDDEADE
jgi:hypothetical protein